ncbi:MAG: metalloregulator ArsR/SmtB family transcription factor [Phycisphaerae bacterium]|nr:metalloregulator ArsR/SmtB family transcription factor [Phycisphaerae bacterium]
MNNETAEHVANVLKAMAHPVRLKIVETLEKGEKTVSEIMAAVGGKQSITSQQLNMMKDKGILACRKEGANVYYRIENPNAIRLLHCIHDNCEKKGT